jgi:chromosome segregation ATPase
MRRALLPLLLLLAACGNDAPKTHAGAAASGETPKKPPPVYPTTGSPAIRDTRTGLTEEIERAEKDLLDGKRPPAHLLYGWNQLAHNLIVAAERAVKEEAAQAARSEISALRERQGQIDKARNDLGAAMLELSRYLDEVRAGGRPPEGFTEDELKDRLGTRQEEARALEKEEAELRERLKAREERLAEGQPPAPQGPTRLTHELEALRELKARIEKLEASVK